MRLGELDGDVTGTDDGRPPVVLLHGLTFDRAMWGPLVRALLLASRDPVVVVDRVLEELESANALFDALNLAVPSDHHIRKLVHPFDVPAMSKLLNAAAADPDHVVGPQRLRLATLSAEVWREFDVIAVGGAASDGPARHVVCRLAAV